MVVMEQYGYKGKKGIMRAGEGSRNLRVVDWLRSERSSFDAKDRN